MSLVGKVGGRVVSYYGNQHLEVKRGLIEIEHGNIPSHITKYHLSLPASWESKKIYLIDIETCGLSNDSPINTISIGGINGEFIVRTFFARDYHEERGILRRTLNILKKADKVFTYNGTAFDITRLSKRMQTQGILSANDGMDLKSTLGERHCDIYPILKELVSSRGKSLLDRKLQTLEKVLFQTHREDEIRGRLIPEIYQKYLSYPEDGEEKEEVDSNMAKVIEHNILDVASIGAVLEFLKREGIQIFKRDI